MLRDGLHIERIDEAGKIMGREIQVNSLEEMCDLMCGGPEKESESI